MDTAIEYGHDVQELIGFLQENKSLKAFRDLFPNPDTDIQQFASRARFSSYDLTGHKVIQQGDLGQEFFIVLSGQLRAIDMTNPEKPDLLGYLTPGAIVGARSLLTDQRQRAATVEVVTKARVAYFNENTWHWLLSKNQNFHRFFEELEDRYSKQSKTDFPGRQTDEVVVIATKRHLVAFIATLPLPLTLLIAPIIFFLMAELLNIQFFAIINSAVALLATVPFLIVAILLALYNYFDWRNDDLIVTTKRVVHIERILFYGEQRRDAPLARIQDVQTESDIFDLLFDSDNLVITTAGVGSIKINHIRRADDVREAILAQAEQAKARVAEAGVSALQHKIANSLNWNDDLPKNVFAVAEEEWNDRVQHATTQHYARAIDYFVPRVKEVDELGGSTVITWRKHRYILFINIIAPTAILLLSIYFSLVASLLFPLQLLLGVAVLGSFIWYVWAYDDWHKDLYQVTDTQIIDIESAAFRLRRSRRDGSFDSIQNVYTEVPNLFYKLLNMGNVIIETAGAEGKFTFKNVYAPASVNREIFNRWSLYQQRKREQDRDSTIKQVMDVLKEYHHLSKVVEENK